MLQPLAVQTKEIPSMGAPTNPSVRSDGGGDGVSEGGNAAESSLVSSGLASFEAMTRERRGAREKHGVRGSTAGLHRECGCVGEYGRAAVRKAVVMSVMVANRLKNGVKRKISCFVQNMN